MNKEISVQYAYKKDGKGERHGDQAERMLAAQARKHNVQPQSQPLPPQLMAGMTPMAPSPALGSMPGINGDFGPPRGMPNGNYQNVPPPQQQARPPPPPMTPLAAPPSGLPARPPPSQAGYGGPQSFMPPGFNNPPPGFPPQQGTPGFGPPPGFGPQSQMPGVPPALPPGFQAGYGRGR